MKSKLFILVSVISLMYLGLMGCSGSSDQKAPETAPPPPAPTTPAPAAPLPTSPGTPTPGTPAPDTPTTPGTPAPGTPTPGTPAPGTPAPGTPAPGTPTPAPPTDTPSPAPEPTPVTPPAVTMPIIRVLGAFNSYTGWREEDGRSIAITLDVPSLAGASLKCYLYKEGLLTRLPFRPTYSPCIVDNTGKLYLDQLLADSGVNPADGKWHFGVWAGPATTAQVGYEFQIANELNYVPRCVPPKSDADYFAYARQHLTIGPGLHQTASLNLDSLNATFNLDPTKTKLENPNITIQGNIDDNWHKASFNSKRRVFTYSDDKKLILMKRNYVSKKRFEESPSASRVNYCANHIRIGGKSYYRSVDGNNYIIPENQDFPEKSLDCNAIVFRADGRGLCILVDAQGNMDGYTIRNAFTKLGSKNYRVFHRQ